MKKNFFMRTAVLLLVSTIAASSISFVFTGARFSSRDVMSNEFGVYHLISFQRTGYHSGGLNASTTTFNNAPAGEWAFLARGTHGMSGTHADAGGRPAVLMGTFDKGTAGNFTVGTRGAGDRRGGTAGHGGHLAFIMSNRTLPGTASADRTGWVAVAGGGGGGGATANYHGGHAGGNGITWAHVDGAVSGVILGGRGGAAGNREAGQTDPANRAGGGGGAASTNNGAPGAGASPNGQHGTWMTGGGGADILAITVHSGGGGGGVWGGGGGAGGAGVSSGPGGGGSSFTGATASVPGVVVNPETYRDHAINLFWDLVGNAHTDTSNASDGRIVLVWLGP